VNFENAFGGVSNPEPLEVAVINNRMVYFNFVVHSQNQTTFKTIHYTWYYREEVKNA